MASKGHHSHHTNTGCSVNGETFLHQSPTPRLRGRLHAQFHLRVMNHGQFYIRLITSIS